MGCKRRRHPTNVTDRGARSLPMLVNSSSSSYLETPGRLSQAPSVLLEFAANRQLNRTSRSEEEAGLAHDSNNNLILIRISQRNKSHRHGLSAILLFTARCRLQGISAGARLTAPALFE